MKTSTKLFLSGTGVLLVGTAALVIRLGVFFFYEQPDTVHFADGDETPTRKTLAYENFDTLELEGFWVVRIDRGETTAAFLRASAPTRERISVAQEGTVLRIRQKFFPLGGPDRAELTISMPSLRALRVRGGNEVIVTGFDERELALDLRGLSDLKGRACRIDAARLTGLGAMGIDLSACAVKNADLDLAGLGEVKLTMTGGSLSGTIDPEVSILHEGPISRKTIMIRPRSRVEEAGEPPE